MPRLARKRPPYSGRPGAYAAFGPETSPVWRLAGCVCRVWPGNVPNERQPPALSLVGDVSRPNAAYAPSQPPYGGRFRAKRGIRTQPTAIRGTFPGQTRHTHLAGRYTGDVSGPNAAYAPGRPLYGGRFRAKRGIRTQRAVPDRTVLA